MRRVAIDFDGVLAHYTGWKGEHDFGYPNPEGAKLAKMLNRAGVVLIVHTCRNNPEMNKETGVNTGVVNYRLQLWLVKNGLGFCELYTGAGKPWAHAYVDDRGVYFSANVGPAVDVFKRVMALVDAPDEETDKLQ